MGLPEYVGRAITATAQVLTGTERGALEERLRDVCVGITFGPSADRGEGRALLDLLVEAVDRSTASRRVAC